MIEISQSADQQLASKSVVIVQLILLEFPSSTLALNNSNMDIDYAGITYKGAYGLGSISEIVDSPGEIKGINFSLFARAEDTIALALDQSNEWQSTKVTIRTAIMDTQYQVLSAPIAWSGLGDTMSISEQDGACAIPATAESSAVDFIRGHKLTYNDADQQMLHPGDLGMSLIDSQVDADVIWPAAAWFHR